MKQKFLLLMMVFLIPGMTTQASEVLQNHAQFYNVGDWWVEGTVTWNWEETPDGPWDFTLCKYTIDGMTTIEGKQYVCVGKQIYDYSKWDGLTIEPKTKDVFFIREDETGKQYIRIPQNQEEYLLWDFSSLEVGKELTYGFLDFLENSDLSNISYFQYSYPINEVGTYELRNGNQVKIINNCYLEGFGDKYFGIAHNLGETMLESRTNILLMRYCKGELVLQNDLLLNRLTQMMGEEFIRKLTAEWVYFSKGQKATIITPTTPDADKGTYYRLDRCENNQIIFTVEPSPKARTPYIIVPKEDFNIDLSTLDLDEYTFDKVAIDGISFIGSYHSDYIGCKDTHYYIIIDDTPDCQRESEYPNDPIIGALRAYIEVYWIAYPNDGKEMEVKLENNITSIEQPSFQLQNDTMFIYDLQGRRLSDKPSKGIFIQNGKKVVIK